MLMTKGQKGRASTDRRALRKVQSVRVQQVETQQEEAQRKVQVLHGDSDSWADKK